MGPLLKALFFTAALSSHAAAAADGAYAILGFGTTPCSWYTNNIAEARQRWGLNSVDAWNALGPYLQYFFGFLTAFNAREDGIYDVSAGISGNDMPLTLLTIVDSYCQDNPTDMLDRAMWDLILKLMPTAQFEKP